MENLGILSLAGSIRLLGTLLCFGGTLVVTLYKGSKLHLWPSIVCKHQMTEETSLLGSHPLRGTLFLVGSCFTFACWYLVGSCFTFACWYLLQGVFTTAAKYTMNSYAVEKRGASYPPMFNALSIVFTIYSCTKSDFAL